MHYANDFYTTLVQTNIVGDIVTLSFQNASFDELISIVFNTIIGTSYTEASTISEKLAKICYHYRVSAYNVNDEYLMLVEIMIE